MNAVEVYKDKNIDLQRLLWNNDQRRMTGRGSGTTFSLLFYVAGHALWDQPNNNYLFVGRHRDMVSEFFLELHQLLRFKGYDLKVVRRNGVLRIEDTHQTIIFGTPETWMHDTRGYALRECFIDAPRAAFDPSEFAFMRTLTSNIFIVS